MLNCLSELWAENEYHNYGTRAILINGECYFKNAEGVIARCDDYDEEDCAVWHALHTYPSRTWKERHAKGVPVKMHFRDFRDCLIKNIEERLKTSKDIIYALQEDGAPILRQRHDGSGSYFTDFRYKPEWLEKNKQNT